MKREAGRKRYEESLRKAEEEREARLRKESEEQDDAFAHTKKEVSEDASDTKSLKRKMREEEKKAAEMVNESGVIVSTYGTNFLSRARNTARYSSAKNILSKKNSLQAKAFRAVWGTDYSDAVETLTKQQIYSGGGLKAESYLAL